jgi:hypothetical protein
MFDLKNLAFGIQSRRPRCTGITQDEIPTEKELYLLLPTYRQETEVPHRPAVDWWYADVSFCV